MANYPQELAQDAAYQSHISRQTELWSLPRPAQGLNTNNKKGRRAAFSSQTDTRMEQSYRCLLL